MTRKMKDSGVEWIGEIPKEWEVVRNKNLFKNQKGIVGNEFETIDRLALTLKGVIDRDKLDSGGLQPTNFDTYQKVYKNNLIFKLIDLENINTSRVGLAHKDGMVSPAYVVLNSNSLKQDMRFYQYFYLSMWHRNIFNMLGDGGVRSNLNKTDLLNLNTLKVNYYKQKAIANFLDDKTLEIDNIISKTKKAIEEYKKYKQSLITETVTQGLDKNVTMKDSGIEWIGDIPEHWEVIRLGFLGRLQNGINKGGDEFGFGYPFINYGDIYRNYQLDKSEFSGLVNSTKKERENYSIKKGDVLFTRTSEIKEEIGYAATCLENIENAVFTGFAIRFRPFKKSRLFPRFSKYYFRSEIHRKYFVKEMNIVTRVSLGQELLMKLSVLLPPLDEQEEISAYLDGKCGEIDNVISTKQKLLIEMEAYKKSLIYETVTGKREME